MNRRLFLGTAATLAVGLGLGGTAGAVSTSTAVPLPKPKSSGAKTLEEALWARKTTREYADTPLPEDVLSGVLWAACGINRPESGKRTAPTAVNRQEIDVFVAKQDGLYLYEPKAHALIKKSASDIRAATGKQTYVPTAPVNLVFVADMSKVAGADAEEKLLLAAADTGFVSQNVYLYCAVAGLATVVRANIDYPALAKTMGLESHQRIILAQSVGYPKA